MTHRILVDLLGFTGGRGGTETYAREICRRLPDAMPGAVFAAVTGRASPERVREFFPGNVEVLRWVGADRLTWAAGEVLAVNGLARRHRADLVWTPANFGPIVGGVPRVSTVHDVIYHHSIAEGSGGPIPHITARLMALTARSATAVITGSAAAARELERFMHVPSSDVHVIAHGTNDPPAVTSPWTHLNRLGIPRDRPLVLSTGNRLPHKNFSGLLAAIATLPAEQRPTVVVTGGGDDDPLRAEVRRRGLQKDVMLAGWVTPEQLQSLYAVAALYVCPSLSEGFGLPIIDAMRRGCLVLANDVPVLHEVGGDAAYYADATDPETFGAAIVTALSEPDPERTEAGREWSRQFTWERAAAQTAGVFSAVLADHA